MFLDQVDLQAREIQQMAAHDVDIGRPVPPQPLDLIERPGINQLGAGSEEDLVQSEIHQDPESSVANARRGQEPHENASTSGPRNA
ncbi:hypothetical protein PGTUg99_008228 [Puccinia graminis f. sp. tritici]|uniref:Uncharacterized protein n=1 Tax=Puccinia graminis f. sp. tritici TaxID=56615 RepID=A0A5B0RY03_PUCGR|nr:hypothetical protein PGTUg99_008228 [Puccinia graminis f. sp. tritici]